jgi:oligopeptide transport system permease protein
MATEQTIINPLLIETGVPATRDHRGLWSDAWRRLRRNRFALLGLVVLLAVVVVAFAAPRVAALERHEPTTISRANQEGPSGEHWFGTDQLGRDVWARTLEGVRISLQIGVGTQLIVLVLGLSFGMLAVLGGKLADNLVMRFTDIMFSVPDVLLFILVREILRGHDDIPVNLGLTSFSVPFDPSDTVVLIMAIGFISWTTVARLVRGQMLSLRERDFVLAAQALGATRGRVVLQHMLPNTLGPVIVALTFGVPAAIFAEAALSFIGLGVPPPDVSLGRLTYEGYNVIQRNTWSVVFPASAIAVLMLCFTFVGDGLRDALDPRTR